MKHKSKNPGVMEHKSKNPAVMEHKNKSCVVMEHKTYQHNNIKTFLNPEKFNNVPKSRKA